MGESPAMLPRAQTAYGCHDKKTSSVSINGAKPMIPYARNTLPARAHREQDYSRVQQRWGQRQLQSQSEFVAKNLKRYW